MCVSRPIPTQGLGIEAITVDHRGGSDFRGCGSQGVKHMEAGHRDAFAPLVDLTSLALGIANDHPHRHPRERRQKQGR